ncbi:hypothetical protein CFOL_v3_13649, partial [Cephalotus follicularis]
FHSFNIKSFQKQHDKVTLQVAKTKLQPIHQNNPLLPKTKLLPIHQNNKSPPIKLSWLHKNFTKRQQMSCPKSSALTMPLLCVPNCTSCIWSFSCCRLSTLLCRQLSCDGITWLGLGY